MRVLVVEDEKVMAAGLRAGLEAEGFAVDVATGPLRCPMSGSRVRREARMAELTEIAVRSELQAVVDGGVAIRVHDRVAQLGHTTPNINARQREAWSEFVRVVALAVKA